VKAKKTNMQLVHLQIPKEVLERLDNYRASLRPLPPRSAVIRDILVTALETTLK